MELSPDCQELVSKSIACVPERAVANRGNLFGKLQPKKTLARMVDALVVELPIKLVVVAKEKEFLVQEVNGPTLTSESREIHNSLVALLVFAENFNFPFG